MSIFSRSKGARGERELLTMLASDLGVPLMRNLSQSRSGGADCIELPGLAVEIKRHEQLNVTAWWRQACEQAGKEQRPILFYRQSRRPWSMVAPLDLLNPELPTDQTATLDYPAALCVLGNFLAHTRQSSENNK